MSVALHPTKIRSGSKEVNIMSKSVNRDARGAQIRTLAGGAMLTAIVVVLQFFASQIHFGMFSITLVLAPIVVGAALFGPFIAMWLGFVFGVCVLLSGDAGAFLTVNAAGTIITVLLKGIACGAGAGFVYAGLKKCNRYVSTFLAAVVAPICNTGVFLLGCRLFFWETLEGWGKAADFETIGAYVVFGLVGVNFLVEMGTNALLAPLVVRLVDLVEKQFKK